MTLLAMTRMVKSCSARPDENPDNCPLNRSARPNVACVKNLVRMERTAAVGAAFSANTNCDDVVVHCGSKRQAEYVLKRIIERLAECKLEVNEAKTRIVYCKDKRRRGSHEHEQFDYLGYTFRPRLCKGGKTRGYFVGFNPGISNEAKREIRRVVRTWCLHLRSGQSLNDLARTVNIVVRGWINYYGRYFPSELYSTLRHINLYLVRWAQRKYRRLKRHPTRAWRWLTNVMKRAPGLFAHWGTGQQRLFHLAG